MLETSLARLNESSAEDRRVAEVFALASLRTNLEENLIPPSEALATAEAHRTEQTEEWTRAVHAALVALSDLRQAGQRIVQA